MKKVLKNILSFAVILTFILFSFVYTASAFNEKPEINWSLWDRFIKYDLRITDYDSLTDEEKELCKFIFETERSSEDTIICARARQILAGYDVGDRVTLEQAEHFYDIMDSSFLDGTTCILYDYKNNKIYANPLYDNVILRKVPDIKHLDYMEDYNEYWLDDKGTEKILTSLNNTSFAGEGLEEFYIYVKYDENGKQMDEQIIPRINEELDTIEKDGCIYKVYPDNTLALSELTDKNSLSVTIPDNIDGMPVICIKPYAFSESAVSEVVLPESLKYIDALAFDECTNLNKINFPESLESIGGCSFNNCGSLGDILINCPNLQIPSAPFENASAKNITVNTKVISSWFIKSFEKFKTFTIGNDTQEIGFHFMTGDFEIPENVKTISSEGGHIPFDLTIPASIEIFGAYNEARGEYSGSCIDSPANVPLLNKESALEPYCTISGWYGTEAHSYAISHNLKFNPLDDIAYGDTNNDGEINITDAVILQKYLLRCGTVGYEADVNKDGKINVFDMIVMKRNLIDNNIQEY